MKRWIVKPFLYLLVLAVLYVLVVQVLRWVAFGEAEREALALMEPLPPPPAGESGYKFLGLDELDIPLEALDAALATDLAAYRDWHADGARRLEAGDHASRFVSPLQADYPARAVFAPPEEACGLRERDCLARLRGNEDSIRAWLADEADRLALAERALASETLANPYPLAGDSPIAAFALLRLPLNDIALQALDGDLPRALNRACGLLAAERRFLGQDGLLIDKVVHGALVEGASGLVLALRRQDPSLPLPASCAAALAPVQPESFLACGAYRHEHELVASLSRQLDQLRDGSWRPTAWLASRVLSDDRLFRAWNAEYFVPLCRPEGVAAILEGRVPAMAPRRDHRYGLDFWAAPISRILADIAAPAYDQYQHRLLDNAAVLRLHLAAIAAVGGELSADQVPAAAASPGYTIAIDGGHWLLPLRHPQPNVDETLRVAIPGAEAPAPAD